MLSAVVRKLWTLSAESRYIAAIARWHLNTGPDLGGVLAMQQRFTFTVNGEQRRVTTDPDRPLLDVLREDLGSHRLQVWLRRAAMRRVHRAGRWPADVLVLDARGHRQ